MKEQTSQKERTVASAKAGGPVIVLAPVVVFLLRQAGIEPTPEIVALLTGVIMWGAGRLVSRFGK